MTKRLQASILSIVALALVPSLSNLAQAGYLSGFEGNTKGTSTNASLVGTVNFAVLDRLSGASSVGDVYGTGLPGFDSDAVAGGGSGAFNTSGRYLYLYQLVSSPTATATSSFFGASSAAPVTVSSYEQWSLLLADNSGGISTSNDFGADGLGFSVSPGANIGVVDPHVDTSANPASLAGAILQVTSNSFAGFFTSPVTPGVITRIFGYTTNAPPIYASFPGGSTFSGARIPVAAPEPSSLALILFGGAGCLAWRIHNRARKGKGDAKLAGFGL